MKTERSFMWRWHSSHAGGRNRIRECKILYVIFKCNVCSVDCLEYTNALSNHELIIYDPLNIAIILILYISALL